MICVLAAGAADVSQPLGAAAPVPLPPREGLGEGRTGDDSHRDAVPLNEKQLDAEPSPSPSLRGRGEDDADTPLRFAYVEIHIDPHGRPLAAWQFEFEAATENIVIVGIEGGEPAAFAEPPYYDPKAIQSQRVIVADFNTAPADQLPDAPARIATIHVMIRGDVQPRYVLKLTTAADPAGRRIDADIRFEEGTAP